MLDLIKQRVKGLLKWRTYYRRKVSEKYAKETFLSTC